MEILTVISILAIVSALAAPNMVEMLRGNRISGEISELVGSIQYARSEALRRGSSISMCPSTDQQSCAKTNQWNSGWIIFEDAAGNGTPPTDGPLKLTPKMNGGDTITSSNNENLIRINLDGFLIDLPSSGIIRFKFDSTPASTNSKRCVNINTMGVARIHKVGQEDCA